MDAIKLLQAVAGTGKTITVAYGGGSRPGESRQLTVISCSNAEMRVQEVGSTLSKQSQYRTKTVT